jgi:hypothetical protein
MFLAETIWQQQEGTLLSIENWLVLATVGVGILLIVGICIVEAKLGRANRIARATHDLLKAMATEQQKGNEILEKIAARTGRIAPPPVPPASPKDDGHRPPLQEEKPPEVYRID